MGQNATAIFEPNADRGVVWALVASGAATSNQPANPCTQAPIPPAVVQAFSTAGRHACQASVFTVPPQYR